MSISLKNHEDRITELEKIGGSKLELLANYMYYDTPTPINFKQYDALYVINSLGNTNRRNESNFCYLIPRNILENNIDSYIFKDLGVDMSSSGTFMSISVSSSNATVRLSDYLSNGIYKASQLYIYGLKLYYNFSYNIYRLTQILLDSPFFEGLSSQKGGARTI